MTLSEEGRRPVSPRPDWYAATARFERAVPLKTAWQIVNTLIPYLILWYGMVSFLRAGRPFWMILPGVAVAGLLFVRLFILFHDCAHGSLFSSRRANRAFGVIFGVLTFTPFGKWRASHWQHHATVADLDRRGTGDVWTMTRKEFAAAPRWKRLVYRLARNPVVMFILGPAPVFLVAQRLPLMTKSRKEVNSILLTDLGVAGLIVAAGVGFGFGTFFVIQVPVLMIAGMLGFWLFFIQHQFPGVYWARHAEWDRLRAATEGSSYYKLPRILRWFTGDIGIHYIHHIRPRIPNYRLEECRRAVPGLEKVEPITLFRSLRCLRLHLYDEEERQLIGFGSAREAKPG